MLECNVVVSITSMSVNIMVLNFSIVFFRFVLLFDMFLYVLYTVIKNDIKFDIAIVYLICLVEIVDDVVKFLINTYIMNSHLVTNIVPTHFGIVFFLILCHIVNIRSTHSNVYMDFVIFVPSDQK